MTTTTLTSYASTYGVGRRHVHFNVRSSTPTTGAMNDRDAQGQWRVERGGFVHRVNGVLDFAWLGLDGDVVHARAIDRAGNAGPWSTYTFSVAANTAADLIRYVDNTASGGAAGTSGDPYQTVAEAKSYMESNLTDGQVGVIYLREGQTHTMGTAAAWNNGSTERLVRFVRWGTSGARPVMSWTNGSTTGFSPGLLGSVHIDGVDLDGGLSTSGNTAPAVDLGRFGGTTGDRAPYNFMAVDCDIDRFHIGVISTESLTYTSRGNACFGFVALQNVEITGTDSYHINGLGWVDQLLWRDVTIGQKLSGSTSGNGEVVRVFDFGRHYVESLTVEAIEGGATIRISSGMGSSTSGMQTGSWYGIDHQGDGWSTDDLWLEHNGTESGTGYWQDIRFVNCHLGAGRFWVHVGDAPSQSTVIDRLDFINCSGGGQFDIRTGSVGGTVSSVRLRDCAVIRDYQDGALVNVVGAAARYATDCFEVHGCYVLFVPASNDGCFFYRAENMTTSEFDARVGASNYNHTGKGEFPPIDWANTSSGSVSLASWQGGASGHDANSTQTDSTTFNLTDDGIPSSTTRDLRLASDSGPLAGTGYALASHVAIDSDGYLRSTTAPDAGPYEYGASTLPDDPTLGAADIEPTGIASAEAFGSVTLFVEATLTPSSITTGEAFGSASVLVEATLTPSSIASAEVFGSATLTVEQTLTPSAIASGEAFGSATLSVDQVITPSSITTGEAFGSTTILTEQTLTTSSIATGETFGSATVLVEQTVTPSSIGSGEVFGTPTFDVEGIISPSGITTGEVFGSANVLTDLILTPSSIATGETFGSATVGVEQTVTPTGIATGEGFGAAVVSVAQDVSPTAIISGEAFGTTALVVELLLSTPSIPTGEAFGTAAVLVEQTVSPSSIATGDGFGSPTVVVEQLAIEPTSIASAEAFGSTAVLAELILTASSISSGEAFGTATLAVSQTIATKVVLQSDFVNVVVSPTGGYSEVEVTRDTDGVMRFYNATGGGASDPQLDAIAGLTPSADQMIYWTGATTAAMADLSSFARTIIDDADAVAVRSTIGAASATNAYYRRIEYMAQPGANLTLSNQTIDVRFLGNSNRNIKIADLSPCSEVRLSMRVMTASVSVNSPRLVAKYSASYTTTLGSLSDIGTSEVSASLSSTGLASSGWIAIAPGAQIDPAYVVVTQIGGDAVADPVVAQVGIEFR